MDEFEVAESGCKEDVGFGSAFNEEARDFGMFADEVLGGSGFVIDVFGVDFGAVIEKEFGDLEVAREMERMLAVASARGHERWICANEGAEVIHPTEAGGLMDTDDCATLNGVLGEIVVGVIEEAEAAGPPLAFGVDVGAVFEKEVEHFARADVADGGRIEGTYRSIDKFFEFRM